MTFVQMHSPPERFNLLGLVSLCLRKEINNHIILQGYPWIGISYQV